MAAFASLILTSKIQHHDTPHDNGRRQNAITVWELKLSMRKMNTDAVQIQYSWGFISSTAQHLLILSKQCEFCTQQATVTSLPFAFYCCISCKHQYYTLPLNSPTLILILQLSSSLWRHQQNNIILYVFIQYVLLYDYDEYSVQTRSRMCYFSGNCMVLM